MIRKIFKRRKYRNQDIAPDEIFLDSANIQDFDRDQFEGRMETAIGTRTIVSVGIVCILVILFFIGRVWILQVEKGQAYAQLSENNKLRHTVIFANRGNIYDRNEVPLAWNTPKDEEHDFSLRQYIEIPGFSNLLGYIKYPQKDKAGFYYQEEFTGFDGIEAFYNEELSGSNGLKIIETDALQDVVSANTIVSPDHGENVVLTIDADIQEQLYKAISDIAGQVGFRGGGGVITNVETGEVIALVTYPGFDSNVLTNGQDQDFINQMLTDSREPFLNRVIFGLYTPGSIMKPYVALAALNENVIDKTTNIISRGEIEIPNPYNPENPSIFTDWKAHGSVDVKRALAVSSNIYFYVVGGGYKDQDGLGIRMIEKYLRTFGFGTPTTGRLFEGPEGTIPNPEWKEEVFDGDPWRLGDTYFTAIGQYGVQVTPLQVVRAVASIANGGTLINPVLVQGEKTSVADISGEFSERHLNSVKEGMREAVIDGTARGLNIPETDIAAKTGTAELGVSKDNVNSWVTGFWPYEEPKYAFTIVMEKGSRSNLIGGVAVMRQLLDYMRVSKPEYFE